MNRKIMEFMREHKINPMGGCHRLFSSLGFFTMLRSAVELRGLSFWICDPSESDTAAHIFGFPVNPMPMLMAVTMLLKPGLPDFHHESMVLVQLLISPNQQFLLVDLYFDGAKHVEHSADHPKSDVPDANIANAALAKPIKAKPKNKRKK